MARILIANDDAEFLDICREVLASAGHAVRAVANGAVALALAREWNPELVLLDWRMPDMEGTTAVRALRRDPRTASLRILLMSGSENGAEAAAQAGADAFLAKPFNADQLVKSIDRLLASSEAHP